MYQTLEAVLIMRYYINMKQSKIHKQSNNNWTIVVTSFLIIITNLIWYNYTIGQDIVNKRTENAVQEHERELRELRQINK